MSKTEYSSPPARGNGLFQRLKTHLTYDNPEDEANLQQYMKERLTKKAELWAFFLFGFGYQGASFVTGALLQPILIQQVATQASRLQSDSSIPCPTNDELIPEGDRCVVPFGAIRVSPTTYTLLLNVVSVWCTIFISLGTSAIADHGRSSKKLMLFCCTMLAITTALMILGTLKAELWWLSSMFMVLALIFSGATLNFYDAHIPILARHHPTVVKAMADHGENSTEHVQAKVKIATFLSGGLSASGYVGGIVLVILSALIIAAGGQSARTLGFTMVMSAVYILIFMCAYAKLSYQRTAQPLPRGANLLTFGYVRIAKTVRQVRRLKTMFFYLCMWFILGDGLTSMTSMAVLIAKDQLKATNSALIIVALIQYVCAGLGMWFWIWLQNNKGVKPKTVIIINSCLFGLIPVYCLLGLIKGVSIGMKQTWEMYMLAAFFGLFIGAIGATNRVIFAMFIPLGHENELYALFEMVNTTSSWIGPLICAAIIESAGIRQIWWFLATQFFIPAAMLFYVDVEKGRQDAIEFYKNEQKEKEGTQVEEIHDEKDVKLV